MSYNQYTKTEFIIDQFHFCQYVFFYFICKTKHHCDKPSFEKDTYELHTYYPLCTYFSIQCPYCT